MIVTVRKPLIRDYGVHIGKASDSKYNFYDYINTLDLNNYFIYKSSNKIKIITISDFKMFSYSQYLLIKKDRFDIKQNIDKWVLWFDKNNIYIRYMTHLLPNYEYVMNLITMK